MTSLAYSMFLEAIPAVLHWSKLLSFYLGENFEMPLSVQEDNQATILVVKKGWSPKLRHIAKTHKVDLGSLSEVFENPSVSIEYIDITKQSADIFTKALEPQKWGNAIALIGLRSDL